jgi:O-antigen ligase
VGKKKRRRERIEPGADIGAVVAVAALCVALAGTALAVDSSAGAAFDAPKRLIALVGTAIAAAAAFAFARSGDPAMTSPWREAPVSRPAAFLLALAALLGGLVAALASPRREVSLDALRALATLSLLLPLGASRAVAKGGRWLVAVFLGSSAVNATVSILQSRGLFRPFSLETFGERQNTGAYAGNVGYLAITLALAVTLALGLLLMARNPAVRAACGIALLLFAVALVVNRNLTALTSALFGAAALLMLRFRRRAALPIAAAVIAAAVAVSAYAPLRSRAKELARAARTGDWDALVSFRGGPWAAAAEMIRERPLTGFGPGTFSAEYVPHRLAAEIQARRRFVSPLLTSSYGEAHCDYLQGFCDAGVPVGLVLLGAVAGLFVAIGKTAWRAKTTEAILLFAVLCAGAAAALTWFPLQRPVTAVPLLLAAGRSWRISVAAAAPAIGPIP